jgi:hypothetical protein
MHKRIETVEQASAQLKRRRSLCLHLTGSCAGETATEKEVARNAGEPSLNQPECSASLPTLNFHASFSQRRIARLQNEKTALEHKVSAAAPAAPLPSSVAPHAANAVAQVERGEEAHAILMKDRVKLFVDMESEQESMTLRTIRSNSFGSVGSGAPMANDRTAASGGAGFGRSPGYAVSSANR